MGKTYIIDAYTLNPINPAEIFGKDAKRLLKACDTVFKNWLTSGQYEGCYRARSRPTLEDVRKNVSKVDNIMDAYKAAMAEWETANPEEVAKEQASRNEWEKKRDKQFRIIYGIARRHGLYLEWYGVNGVACCGDRWTIYKQKKCIARICCS